MDIHRRSGAPAVEPPESTFTGAVQISGYFQRSSPSRLAGAAVAFPPGARTPWKVNPLGQTVVVTSGVGRAQCEGEDVVEIQAGDVVWFPPGQQHWEGATPDSSMTYVAMHEGSVQFGHRVTDREYGAPSAGGRV